TCCIGRRDDEEPLVFGEVPTDIPTRRVRAAKDEGIFALRRAELMEEKLMLIGYPRECTAFFGLFIATVVKALIAPPSQSAELHVYQGIANNGLIFRADDNDFSPVGTALRYLVSYQATIT